jgi:hypothetical protein
MKSEAMTIENMPAEAPVSLEGLPIAQRNSETWQELPETWNALRVLILALEFEQGELMNSNF